jgi:hypothetical protein
MLFRDANGKLVEIRKYDFTNDTMFYRHLARLKQQTTNVYTFMQHASQRQGSGPVPKNK